MRQWQRCGVGFASAFLVWGLACPIAKADEATVKLYNQNVHSVVWIAIPKDKHIVVGSGTLIDASRRLILTNFHVAGDGGFVYVLFPMYDKSGKLIAERDPYLARLRNQQAVRAKVVFYRPESDLAVVQAESLPHDAKALPLAADSPSPGQQVHSLGNPGAAGGAMWLLTEGTVRQVLRRRIKSIPSSGDGPDFEIDAKVVYAQSPNNPGDSGGPLMNSSGELIGITQGGMREAQGISIFIDISEIRDFLTKARVLNADGKLPAPPAQPRSTVASNQPRTDLRAPAIDPNDPNAKQERAATPTLELAIALYKEDRYREARKCLQSVVDEYPGTKAAKQAKEMLEKIKDSK